MAEAWCDFNDLPKDACSHCNGADEREKKAATYYTASRVVVAQYGGLCGHCGRSYDADALIVMAAPADGSQGVWCLLDHVERSTF